MLSTISKTASLAANFLFSRPFYASFDVTNYCNLRCEGCDYPVLFGRNLLGKDKPTESIETRIERLREAFGSMIIVLAGFEPTMRKDLPEIILAASNSNYVGIVTNGTLITPEKARSYWEAGLTFASVSFPTFDNERFKELTGVKRYDLSDVRNALETLIATAPRHRIPPAIVAITATIDNLTTPKELSELAVYAQQAGAKVSFQPYSASKPASAAQEYCVEEDKRTITIQTLEGKFKGSIAETIEQIRRNHPVVIGRLSALRNFDVFVRDGSIPFKPRSLKVYESGEVSLYPEAMTFSNIDTRTPQEVWHDYRGHVEDIRQNGGFRAPNAYRCVNLTNPSMPLGDIIGGTWRSIARLS